MIPRSCPFHKKNKESRIGHIPRPNECQRVQIYVEKGPKMTTFRCPFGVLWPNCPPGSQRECKRRIFYRFLRNRGGQIEGCIRPFASFQKTHKHTTKNKKPLPRAPQGRFSRDVLDHLHIFINRCSRKRYKKDRKRANFPPKAGSQKREKPFRTPIL